jgi:hypothetical protein
MLPPSTADERKSPLIVLGITREKVIGGCSIARDSYNSRDEDFVAAYRDLVGAGITEAKEDMRRIEGEFDVESSNGIWSKRVRARIPRRG